MAPNHGETPAHGTDPRSVLTAAEAERAGIANAKTVRTWARRGYLYPVGVDSATGTQGRGHRSPLYRRGDLERMAARQRRAATQRHEDTST
jgi:hypothetical protein